ncbi:MAG: hypothetical protein IKX59_03080 [Bacteroidales bacterium]|nr:hypothetical protein [Bacteroidales bacterium]
MIPFVVTNHATVWIVMGHPNGSRELHFVQKILRVDVACAAGSHTVKKDDKIAKLIYAESAAHTMPRLRSNGLSEKD